MPRMKKKGTSGEAKNFITRTQAVRKLQISLPDFRRLCIFKGIYPREPNNKKKVSKSATPSTTFYYTKDVQYLLHEPLLNKFREHKALAKKIGRALGKGEVKDAARLEKSLTPRITLDHIIKERYPTFVDALRDLDDALSMLFLFANLPSSHMIAPKTIALCQRLCFEFQHYLIMTHSLRKSFLSIKGIYYQATIQGQDILWLVPYKFVQRETATVDFRIMATFIEFYTTLLGFVNYRLYTSIGLVYPPKFDVNVDERGAELGAYTLQGRDVVAEQRSLNGPDAETAIPAEEATSKAQQAADALESAAEASNDTTDTLNQPATEVDASKAFDEFVPTAPDADTLPQPDQSENEAASLFTPFVFFLSRETPRQPLEFLLKSFGCKRVGWDATLGEGAFAADEDDPRITHQVVDRPMQTVSPNVDTDGQQSSAISRGKRVAGRTYIQPQWVWDCANQCKLLRPDLYAPGATLPPHLSPWVKPTRGAYDPTIPLDADEVEILDEEEDERKDPDIINGVDSVKAISDLNGEEADVPDEVESGSEGSEMDDEDIDIEPATNEDDWAGFASDQEANEAVVRQRELEAEVSGQTPTLAKNVPSEAKKRKAEQERQRRGEEEERARLVGMLPRRKRKLFEKMEYSNAKKAEEEKVLKAKRRRIERNAPSGLL